MVFKSVTDLLGFLMKQLSRKFLRFTEDCGEQKHQISATHFDSSLPLYIHVPFCYTLCPFCCFNRYSFSENKVRLYFHNLKKELDFYIQKGFKFTNFYFGGGTPTILMDELLDFIEFLDDNFDVRKISLETTLREINSENIDSLKAAGINRLSVGIQSFDNYVLKSMGRLANSGEEAKEKLEMVQGQFDTVNADFIFNFPTQTIDKFSIDINTFKNMRIDQATFYPLMPSPNKMTAMEKLFKRIDTSREKSFYEILLKELHEKGYKASTVWCFSRGDRMIDEYIIDFDDYVGIGASALSFLNGDFYVNTFSLDRYDKLISRGKCPVVLWKELTEREHQQYYMLTKLFGMKIDPQRFQRRFHSDIYKKLKLELWFFKTFGLLIENERISVTPKGMYSLSVMMKEFFAGLNKLREYCIQNRI